MNGWERIILMKKMRNDEWKRFRYKYTKTCSRQLVIKSTLFLFSFQSNFIECHPKRKAFIPTMEMYNLQLRVHSAIISKQMCNLKWKGNWAQSQNKCNGMRLPDSLWIFAWYFNLFVWTREHRWIYVVLLQGTGTATQNTHRMTTVLKVVGIKQENTLQKLHMVWNLLFATRIGIVMRCSSHFQI